MNRQSFYFAFFLILVGCSSTDKESPHLFHKGKGGGALDQIEIDGEGPHHSTVNHLENVTEIDDPQSYSLPGLTSQEDRNVLENAELIPSVNLPGGGGDNSLATATSYVKQKHQNLMKTGEISSELMVLDRKEIVRSNLKKGRSQFSLTYLKDDFDVKDSRGIFNKSFKEGPDSKRTGLLVVGVKRFLYRGSFEVQLGGNLGFGFFQGRGYFESDQISEAVFTVWTVPVDLALSVQVPISSFMKLEVEGGPSVMGLLQTRSDKEPAESKKRRRQISPGYFAAARFKVSLSSMFESVAFPYYRDYSVSNVLFHLELRKQSYTSFQDSIEITGQSIGAGLSFEFF